MKRAVIKASGSEFTKNLDTGVVYITGEKGKGGSAHVAVEADNTLRSAAVVKVIEVISEGPIVGVCGGARGILINNTPLMNADGSYNFPRVGWDYRVGLPSQDYMPGFASAAAEVSINAPLILATPVIRTTTSLNIDSVKLAMLLPQGLSLQNTTNGDLNGSTVQFRVDTKLTASGTWTAYNTYTIAGKTTSPYEAQYRIDRPAGAGLWDIRVVRLTADPAAQEKTQTTVARVTEIIDVKLGYNDTAVIGLAIDAESVGSSIPTRSYMVKGKIVSVPTNYTEANIIGGALGTTGTAYSGVWNGSFQQAWTQNPAWILYDLLTHPRYGMGEFISVNDIDIYSFYDAAVYNDTLVSDGNGGLESRFTFGGSLVSQEDAGKILQLVAGSFRARILQINGKWTILQDRPASPIRNISNSNVQDGQFVYKSTGLFERHTAFNVTWNNRSDRYLQKVSTVEDSVGIARYGYFPLDLAAYGATTEGQAIRMGKWALDTEQNQTETVTFKMGLNGFDLLPNDIFNLFDEDYAGVNGGGRIISVVGTTVTLDKPVTLAVGSSISLTLADGITVQTRGITQTSGTTATFTVASAFSTAVLAGADYVVTTSVAARQFKVLNLRFPAEHVIEVEALEHDANKYSRVETGVSVAAEVFSNANAINSTVVVAPTDLTFLETAITNPDGTISRSISTSWVAATLGSRAVGYQVRYSRNGETSTLLDTPLTMVSIPAVTDGTYAVSIIAYDGAGRLCGSALVGSYVINSAAAGTLGAITNLYAKGTSLTTWNSDDLTVTWTANAANTKPTQDYLVVIKTAGSVTLHSEYVSGTSFMYTLTAMAADAALAGVALQTTLSITITPRDLFNRLGAAASASFTNAKPAAPTMVLVAGAKSISITLSPCTDADYRGSLIYASAVSGFTPAPGNLVYDGAANFYMLNNAAASMMYIKAAHYDAYGKTGLTFSTEYSITPLALINGVVSGTVLPVDLAANGGQNTFFLDSADQALRGLYTWSGSTWIRQAGADNSVTMNMLVDSAVDATKIAKSIDPVAVVNELPSGLFKRPSVGTYVGVDSLVKYAVPNEPRYDYNPVTGALSGLLIEAAAKNNLFKSTDILNANGWLHGATLANFFTTTFSNEIKQPDGTSDKVAKFVAAAVPAVLFLRQVGVNGVAGAHTTSIYIYVPTQAGVTSWGFQSDWDNANASNTVSSTVFNKWVRVSVLATLTATRGFLDFNITRNGTSPTTGFTFYAAMPQDELGSTMTSYVPSVRTFYSRATAITNMLLYSEQFDNTAWTKGNCTITANAATSPDGTANADTVVRTAASNHFLYQTVVVASPASRTFTFSIWIAFGTLTGNINIYFKDGAGTVQGTAKTAVTNGNWSRYDVTAAFSAGATANVQVFIDPVNNVGSVGDTFWVWGAQLEEAAVAGAYITTTSAAASKATAETLYDKNGNVVLAEPNTGRLSYTPDNLSLQPFDLIEARATNLLTSSDYFGVNETGNFIFNKSSVSITYDGTLAPDGVSQAPKMIETGVTDFHYISKQVRVSESKMYTFSAHLKMGSVRYMWVEMQTRANSFPVAIFDLLTGIVTYIFGCKAVIQPLTDGWFRCSITVDSSVGAVYRPSFYVGFGSSSGTNVTYLGSRANYGYVWGLQIEEGTIASSYVPSKASFSSSAQVKSYVNSLGLIAYAPANQARLTYTPTNLSAAPTPLLEGAGANLALYSEQFDNAYWVKAGTSIVANAVTAPDGTLTADKLVDNSTLTTHVMYANVGTLVGAGVTWSIFIKAAGITQISLTSYEAVTPSNPVSAVFDLATKTVTSKNATTVIADIEEYPNGWFRCRVTSVTAPLQATAFHVYLVKGGLSTYAGDGVAGVYIWGAQLTNDKSLSAYIPTTSIQVAVTADAISGGETSRSADVVTDTYGQRSADVAGYTTPRILFNTSDAKMYRIDYAVPAWIATTSARDITDLIEANQIVANSITAGQIAAGAIGASEIAAGAISADKLAVGNTRNLIPISSWEHGTVKGASLGFNNTSQVPTFSWRSGETLQLVYAATPATATSTDVSLLDGGTISVVAGKRYEFSVYLNTHRCTAFVRLVWINSAGSQISLQDGNSVSNWNTLGDTLAAYGRSVTIGVAPVGAVKVNLLVTTTYNAQTNPHTFFLRALFGEATANQTEASPWSPAGVTTIDGSKIVTNSITANRLNITGGLSSITADIGSITAGNITLNTTGYIAGGMTAYGIGTGFYAGYYLGSYVMSVGNSTAGFTWSGSTFTIKGDLLAGSININNKFMVDSSGNVTLKSATTGARLEIVNDVIRVYDAAGILRVKLGNLA